MSARGAKPRRAALAVALLCAVTSCSVGSPGPTVDVDRAMSHVAVLSATPRPRDSARSAAAYAYIMQQLADAGVTAEELAVGKVDLPAIVILGATLRSAHTVETRDRNLVARFGPRGKALLVMAHYDTVESSPGAVDNAAAVGIVIELARVLHDHPPSQPVILAFTANEEIGLVGGEALADQLGGEIDFAIALDLIGGTGRLTLNGASKLVGAAEMHWLADAADRAGVELSAPLAHRVVSRWWPQAERSDHSPFTRRGIRAVHFYNRGQDGEWIDLAYHSDRDVYARVHRESVDETARLLRALVTVSPPAHDGDGFWLPFAANTVVPRWILVVFELVLIAIALVTLLLVFLDHRQRPHARGAGLLAGIACYAAGFGALLLVPYFANDSIPSIPHLASVARLEIAEAAILAGVLGLATRVVRRFAPWIGGARYLAIAIGFPLLLGTGLWIAGAPEIAWIWLVPAAVIALAPRLGRAGLVAVPMSLVPAVFVMRPNQLREILFNGFASAETPLAYWIATFGICAAATGAWYLRGKGLGPLGTLVLTLGSALAVVTGVVLLL